MGRTRIDIDEQTAARLDELRRHMRRMGVAGDASRSDLVCALVRWTPAPMVAGMLPSHYRERALEKREAA